MSQLAVPFVRVPSRTVIRGGRMMLESTKRSMMLFKAFKAGKGPAHRAARPPRMALNPLRTRVAQHETPVPLLLPHSVTLSNHAPFFIPMHNTAPSLPLKHSLAPQISNSI